ncbi:MAG: hypothetical protein HPY90_07905 [Syntrophothermus sp.]|uniref:hypothetical protein n=1 Tax=Syntrophothermus sp. TaxID=2736299 RepID=UPI0025796394|nr:hypothetical protein [Syntrophothermus sp.]NSW83185.1 hypothetical protein [Syntrophothermus sp.]
MASKRVARLQRQTKQQAEEKQIVARKAVGYIRVSTDEQAAQGYGLNAFDQPDLEVGRASSLELNRQ